MPVIVWHRDGLVPLGPELTGDSRCSFVQGDFFALAGSVGAFDPRAMGQALRRNLLDIAHSPKSLLDERSSSFCRREGLRALARHLKPGGIFGLWSNDRPDSAFTDHLAGVFAQALAEPVTFDYLLQAGPSRRRCIWPLRSKGSRVRWLFRVRGNGRSNGRRKTR